MNDNYVIEDIRNKNVLLIYPDFPIPKKRKIHHDFLPIGLLKIGTYLRDSNGCHVALHFGNEPTDIYPDYILITSLFTYWSEYVHNSISYYESRYPKAKIIVGGIYATLLKSNLSRKTNVRAYTGLCYSAEKWCREHDVDYSLLPEPVDFQILHGMRGCFRKCKFCGTWKLEPKEEYFENISSMVRKNHVVFYDNNFLKHPQIKQLLVELGDVRVDHKPIIYESQSGFDGRILDQEIADLLKKARFINPRIAWDNSYDDWPMIEKQIDMLLKAGYSSKSIYIFMIFNWDHDFNEMEKKRLKCWKWKVQIADCRYRPLDQLYDRFNSRMIQTSADYFIHPKWNDREVKQFRKNVRRHNICVRHNFGFYSSTMERMRIPKVDYEILKCLSKSEVKRKVSDVWFPDEFSPPSQCKCESLLSYRFQH